MRWEWWRQRLRLKRLMKRISSTLISHKMTCVEWDESDGERDCVSRDWWNESAARWFQTRWRVWNEMRVTETETASQETDETNQLHVDFRQEDVCEMRWEWWRQRLRLKRLMKRISSTLISDKVTCVKWDESDGDRDCVSRDWWNESAARWFHTRW